MNGQSQQLSHLSECLKAELSELMEVTCIVFPPSLYLEMIHRILADSPIFIGAQNVYPADCGAYTGEISASMLKDFQCRHVLVGHSERRHLFNEDENFVAQKFHHVKEHDMIPVLCVGETLKERELQQTEEVIAKQILAVAKNNNHCFKSAIVAYEPVWAIGTGKTATPEQAQEVHHFIRKLISELNTEDAVQLPILYGGSLNEQNAQGLFAMPDIDGGLVGGASLNAEKFVEIVKCIN
ncbi:triosephosphate isomerase [Legionella israelensis]|nr:triosephosphate isomerase [Legionella israelensis]SCX88003.1 triosephosphate isomerase [Legionella israelensis DSM 19235]STX60317.1 triosephosphate isomerase [Legionella israelensis]